MVTNVGTWKSSANEFDNIRQHEFSQTKVIYDSSMEYGTYCGISFENLKLPYSNPIIFTD